MGLGIGLQLGARAAQQGPQQIPCPQRATDRHTRQALHTRAAQQTKQQGFRLIISMLRGQQHLVDTETGRKGCVAGSARRLFKTGTRSHLHIFNLQWHGQGRTQFTAMGRPSIGRNLQAVTGTVAQVQPDVSVQLDLGPQFEVRGRGLQARLTGQLNLRSTVALPAPRVFGEVRTASGSYRAYGQLLTIENGEMVFNGPYDDPALDILAIRPMGR